MSQYNHGVYIEEVPTSLVTPATAECAMPVIVGTAPVHNLSSDTMPPVNEPRLIYRMTDFIAQFGALADTDNKADYTLYQAAEIYLTRYNVAPIVAINVFDPTVHCSTESVADDSADDTTPTVINTPDVNLVTEKDIIGGITDYKRTGISLVEEVFPRFRLTPGQVLAPKFSADPTVAIAINAVCTNICGHFRAMGIIDVPDTVTHYTNVPAWLNDNNCISPNLICMYGNAIYGDVIEPGSIHLEGCIGGRDGENGQMPFYSPSNYQLQAEGLVHANSTLHLTPSEAAYLNGNGIVTGLNMIGGLVAWGDQTTAYPSNTDVKDSSIPIRRMFTWVGNTLVLTAWQFVSGPIRLRLVETVQDTVNMWLNGLVAREAILGGRVTFEEVDNSTTDLMDGKVRWHVYLTPPQAAREINFSLEYDPSYLTTLFSSSV